MLRDFLLADLDGAFFLRPVLLYRLFVLGGSPAKHLPQGRYHVFRRDFVIPAHADAEFLSPGGVDDDVVALREALSVRGEKVNFLPGTELDIHDLHIRLGRHFDLFFHEICSLVSYRMPYTAS